MKQYSSLFEAVQRPESYLLQIEKILISKKDKIQKAVQKQNLAHLAITLSSFLRSFKIKIRPEKNIGDLLGLSKDAFTLTNKYNTIVIKINSGSLLIKDDKYFYIFLNDLLEIIGHEIIHRLQLHNKVSIENQKKIGVQLHKSEKNYRFSKQELMAFAWNIIEEFRYMNYSDNQILKTIQKIEKTNFFSNLRLPLTYKYYLGFFASHNETILENRLHKYIYEYLQ